MLDIIATQKYFRLLLHEGLIPGYIQYIAQEPYVINLYSQKQIDVLKLNKKQKNVLNLDATGSLIFKPPFCSNIIFYYALTLQHPEYRTSPVPIAEMISSNHGAAEITHFLNKWVLTSKLIMNREIKIVQIELDYSWAMMHSACISFNKINVLSYLDKCWEVVNNVKPEFSFSTVLHLCSVHIMHRIQVVKKLMSLF